MQRADAEGIEFWFARDLQVPLGYARWENCQTAIHRAMESCEASGNAISDHFRGVTKMVELGSESKREVDGGVAQPRSATVDRCQTDAIESVSQRSSRWCQTRNTSTSFDPMRYRIA